MVTWASLAPKTMSKGREETGIDWDHRIRGHLGGIGPEWTTRGPLVKGAGHCVAKTPPIEPGQGHSKQTHPIPILPTPTSHHPHPQHPWSRFLNVLGEVWKIYDVSQIMIPALRKLTFTAQKLLFLFGVRSSIDNE